MGVTTLLTRLILRLPLEDTIRRTVWSTARTTTVVPVLTVIARRPANLAALTRQGQIKSVTALTSVVMTLLTRLILRLPLADTIRRTVWLTARTTTVVPVLTVIARRPANLAALTRQGQIKSVTALTSVVTTLLTRL